MRGSSRKSLPRDNQLSQKDAAPMEDRYFYLERQEVHLDELEHHGLILDIGGGGEGVIGLLHGSDVVAIDVSEEELEEAAPGPLKVLMDAQDLLFLDSTFSTASAFFSLMYMPEQEKARAVFAEVFRVLEPGGKFHIWDAIVRSRKDRIKGYYVLPLIVQVKSRRISTGYASSWPEKDHDEEYYQGLAESVGFEVLESRTDGTVLYMALKKPGLGRQRG
jgi:ubiquinone/menaquinone biosynthesis C-methylase UbiE